jgi:hypothetical protein
MPQDRVYKIGLSQSAVRETVSFFLCKSRTKDTASEQWYSPQFCELFAHNTLEELAFLCYVHITYDEAALQEME